MTRNMLDSSILCYGAYRKHVNIIICVLIFSVSYLSFLREDIITDSNAVQKLQTAPPPKRDFLQGKNVILNNCWQQIFHHSKKMSYRSFLSFKESQYRDRRVKIREYCDKKSGKFGEKILKNSLIFDKKDGIGYCQIAKVASSTWCNDFVGLGKHVNSSNVSKFHALFLLQQM